MFGDTLFSSIPFSTFGDEDPVPYSREWINQCPEITDWTDQDVNTITTRNCDNGS